MTISAFANSNTYADDGWSGYGRPTRHQYQEKKRLEAEERQAAYEALLANGPDEVRMYRNRSIRPRLGRKLREIHLARAQR